MDSQPIVMVTFNYRLGVFGEYTVPRRMASLVKTQPEREREIKREPTLFKNWFASCRLSKMYVLCALLET
jgi:hypothetical protein